MIGGFTFNGIDIEDIGLTYAPDLSNTYVYKPSTYKPHEQVFDGHDGGYYYGNTLQPKDFVLRCIYEDQHVLNGVLTKLYSVFYRGKTGRLVFKKRPWCWYVATVTSVDIGQMTNYQNGIVTITLRAYYPFARTDYITIPEGSEDTASLLENSALLPESVWQNETSFASANEPITDGKEILLYNPGTERAKIAVRIAGDVDTGLMIANRTTGQNCRFVAITPEVCSGNKYVQCDSLNGQTILTNGTVSSPGFLYHDYGFIELEPGYPAYRDIDITIGEDGKTLKSDGKFNYDMVNRYVYFSDGTNAKIVNVTDDSTAGINKTVTTEKNGKAQILKMNELYISAYPNGGTINITKLDILFKPTFA